VAWVHGSAFVDLHEILSSSLIERVHPYVFVPRVVWVSVVAVAYWLELERPSHRASYYIGDPQGLLMLLSARLGDRFGLPSRPLSYITLRDRRIYFIKSDGAGSHPSTVRLPSSDKAFIICRLVNTMLSAFICLH
jgi:hypothetical protein